MRLTKSQLDKILDQVEQDVTELLKSEALAKADPGMPAKAEESSEGSSVEPPPPVAGDEASASDSSGSAPAPGAPPVAPEASASSGSESSSGSSGSESSSGSSGSSGSEGSASPEADAGGNPEELQAEYSKLPLEELKTHFLACKAALVSLIGQGDDGAGAPPPDAAPPAPPAPMGPPPGAPPMAPPGAPPMDPTMKSNSEVINLKKSLDDQASLVAKQAEAIEKLSAAFAKVISKPMRKSVDSVSYIQKPGEGTEINMTKSEAKEKLNQITRTKALKKSDRDLINQFVLGHSEIESIAHLLRD